VEAATARREEEEEEEEEELRRPEPRRAARAGATTGRLVVVGAPERCGRVEGAAADATATDDNADIACVRCVAWVGDRLSPSTARSVLRVALRGGGGSLLSK
jgi:hypothetical protein